MVKRRGGFWMLVVATLVVVAASPPMELLLVDLREEGWCGRPKVYGSKGFATFPPLKSIPTSRNS